MSDIPYATKQEVAEVQAENAEVRQAIRELYVLEQRFKPASFDRYREQGQPLAALERILSTEE